MRTSALFGPKSFGFLEIYGAPARAGGGIEPVGHFADKKGKFFAILCGRLICTAPNVYFSTGP